VSPPAIRVLDFAFLALLYLFLLRVVRAVWAELKAPAPSVASSASAQPPQPERASTDGKRSRSAPTKLAYASPDGKTELVDLGEEVTIGRAPDCGLVLAGDNFVSAHHARVLLQEGSYWVEDLGSTNGTLLNGRRLLVRAPLRRGDRLQIGRTALELRR
jgi:pSer/pThr/pTyr-binding forkhead associated (FHA) protein